MGRMVKGVSVGRGSPGSRIAEQIRCSCSRPCRLLLVAGEDLAVLDAGEGDVVPVGRVRRALLLVRNVRLPCSRWSSGEELDRDGGELLVVLEDAAVTGVGVDDQLAALDAPV